MRIFVGLALTLFATGCVVTNAYRFGGFGNLDIVQHAEAVEACLLRPVPSPTGRGSVRYEEMPFVAVPDDIATAVVAALLRDSTYDSNSSIQTLCAPTYYARLRFRRGAKIVDADFCFRCAHIAIHADGRKVTETHFTSGIFVSAMRQLFPEDPLLRKTLRAEPSRPNQPPEPTRGTRGSA